MKTRLMLVVLATLLAQPANTLAQDTASASNAGPVLKGRPYSPNADRACPTRVLFGDTHVHSALSADAGGDTARLASQELIKRFAQGTLSPALNHQPGNPGFALNDTFRDGEAFDSEYLATRADRERLVEIGQTKSDSETHPQGVPMGSDLHRSDGPPAFLVFALRDPTGANLDRIQIVKGWVDDSGAIHEKVHDVVWAGDRQPGRDGMLPPIGSPSRQCPS